MIGSSIEGSAADVMFVLYLIFYYCDPESALVSGSKMCPQLGILIQILKHISRDELG